ncbi:MAG: GGDEF domain-containing protein [Chloroflexi bacterium]|nr:GGDEF domain-containing protein [Chloroflexota bacterium]MBI3742276.1 GGDEF domain-containing protein [Chloroflexota bacterium]
MSASEAAQAAPGDELIRLADLEWLDLSDLVRLDDDWRRTLVLVSRLHLALTAMLALAVIVIGFVSRPSNPADWPAIIGIVLTVGAVGFLVYRAQDNETLLLKSLRVIVFLSILSVSLMVYLLRELQGDYYLLYLLPLITAAGYLGFTGGLLAGVVGSVAYMVVFFLSPVAVAPGAVLALVLRALVFVLISSLLGLIAERHLSMLAALRASHTQAIQLAVTDTKTGLFNQKFLQARLQSELSRAERSKTPATFLMIDVNGLDNINHEHGYSAGDNVLLTLGRIVQKQLRVTDVPSRWGVDEIGVFLYNSESGGAEIVAKRIVADLAKQEFKDPTTNKPFTVQVTQGIATFPAHTNDKSGVELVDRAYQAMRKAKSQRDSLIAVYSN